MSVAHAASRSSTSVRASRAASSGSAAVVSTIRACGAGSDMVHFHAQCTSAGAETESCNKGTALAGPQANGGSRGLQAPETGHATKEALAAGPAAIPRSMPTMHEDGCPNLDSEMWESKPSS